MKIGGVKFVRVRGRVIPIRERFTKGAKVGAKVGAVVGALKTLPHAAEDGFAIVAASSALSAASLGLTLGAVNALAGRKKYPDYYAAQVVKRARRRR